MNFSQGHSGTKVQFVNRACFPKENTPENSHKNGRNSWAFRFGPFFGLVCRGDSWFLQIQIQMQIWNFPNSFFVLYWCSSACGVLMTTIIQIPDFMVKIHILAVVLLSGPSLAFWGVIIWAKFAFYKTLFDKHTIKIGVSAPWFFFFWLKKLRAQIWGVIIWAKLAILSCSQLGPDNNTYLAQIITPQNGIFAFKNVLKYQVFNFVFEHQPELAKKMGKKNDNFSHFAKHRFIKNRFVATPLLTKKLCFSTLIFQRRKDVEQKA